MHFIFRAPFDADAHLQVTPPPGWRLGDLLGATGPAVTGCLVNGTFLPVDASQAYSPRADDHVTVFLRAGEVGSTTLVSKLIYAAVVAVVSTAINLGIQYLMRALTPTPSNTAGKTEQVFGIAGLVEPQASGALVVGGDVVTTPDGLDDHLRVLWEPAVGLRGEGKMHGPQ